MDHFRRYVWRRVILVARVDLAVQKSERLLQEEEVSFELNLIRHGSTRHPELVASSRMPCQGDRVLSYQVKHLTMFFRTVSTHTGVWMDQRWTRLS